MIRTLFVMATGVVSALCAAGNAHAQMQWTDKAFASVSLGVQAPSESLTTTSTAQIYAEPASFTSVQDVGGGAFFDIAGGYKVWKNLALGLGISRVGSKSDIAVTASIPDPLFFDRPRTVTTSVADASHSQTAINLTGTWIMPITDKIDIGYQFGPTIFLVSQDVPGAGTPGIVEPTPTIASLPLESASKTTLGVHFGVDLTYLVTPRVGVGGLVRYSVGSADLVGADESLTVGGFQIGVGVRARF